MKSVLAAGMLAGLLLSPKLWVSSRVYPLLPVVDGLVIPFPLDRFVFGLLVFLLFYIIVQPRPPVAVLGMAGLAMLLVLADQSRLQPWYYQYFFMLLPFGLYSWNKRRPASGDPDTTPARLLNPSRMIVVGTYFYSGLQKLNPGFWSDTGPWLLGPLLRRLQESWGIPPPLVLGAVPLVEVLIGVGLLIRITRPVAIIAAVLMHMVILRLIGPWGRNWNSIVWPWNIAMILLVPLLFWRSGGVRPRSILLGEPRSIYPRLVLLLFGVLPALSFVGLWDKYLSASLYSGRTPQVMLEFGETVLGHLPPQVQAHCSPTQPGRYTLELMMWSIAEMNVPEYPEERIYRGVARSLARHTNGTDWDAVVLSVYHLPKQEEAPPDRVIRFKLETTN